MTEQRQDPPQSPEPLSLTPEQVAAYLQANPEFFVERDELLGEMRIPHQPGDAVSLVERQVMLFRTLIEIGQALGEFDPVFPSDEIARCVVALEDSFGFYPLIGLSPPRTMLLGHIRDYVELTLRCTLPRPEDLEPLPLRSPAGE